VSPANYFIEATYLLASVFFVLGLKAMSHPETARRGMFLAEAGMLAAIIGTLMHQEIVSYEWIIAGLVIGSIVGALMAIWVPMTAMPQRTALSHAFGALAAALVGIAEYSIHGATMGSVTLGALGLEVMLGSLTTTGSLIAAGKLQGFVRGTPIQFKGQHIFNLALFGATIASFVYVLLHPAAAVAFYWMVGLSLLNSYAGLAAAATGFVLSNNVLIIAGTLDGFSGLILSVLMCRAMNRSIGNVLFGGFGAVAAVAGDTGGIMREINLEDAAVQLAYANRVIFVPGYGLATAQAQHAVRELGDLLEGRGVTVKYAIHPVAGRMPGHMNVLLAEANIPYSSLYEMEQINPEFPSTDVAVVIGANDVVNPDARDNPKSPIAGMPILEVDRAKSVIVLKRGQGRGFSGLENPLFYKAVTTMLYGDAKASLTQLAQAVQRA
jgi:NAD(P) transhydrogenase subunit beta